MNESRILNTIDLIEGNLTEAFTVEDLACQAGMSPRTLYREFQRLTATNLMTYVRQRRLTEASKALVNTERTALDIALQYQFKSAEGFSRSFAKMFWRNPSEFRKIASPYSATQKSSFLPEHIELIADSYSDSHLGEPKIISLGPRLMAGLYVVQPHYGFRVEDNLGEGEDLAQTLQQDLAKIPHLIDGSEWNVAFRTQHFMYLHEIENFFAVEVSQQRRLPEPYQYLRLPACDYAVFHHKGCGTLVEFTVSQAFHWLTASSYTLGDGPSMFHLAPGQRFAGDLYIPISTIAQPELHWWRGVNTQYIT